MLQPKNVIIHGLNIRYYQNGDIDNGDVLVFLHGWGSRALHFVKTLECREHSIAIDLPGFGGSESPRDAWSLSDYASFVREFLHVLGITNPMIAGHSFGGAIGMKYCIDGYGCKKLVLIASAGIRRKSARKSVMPFIAKVGKVFFAIPIFRSLRGIVRERFYRAIGSEDYIYAGTLVETYRKVIGEDLSGKIGEIVIPTLLIWGDRDTDTPLCDGRLMHERIRNSAFVVVPDDGHYVFIDNREKFDEIFLSYVA